MLKFLFSLFIKSIFLLNVFSHKGAAAFFFNAELFVGCFKLRVHERMSLMFSVMVAQPLVFLKFGNNFILSSIPFRELLLVLLHEPLELFLPSSFKASELLNDTVWNVSQVEQNDDQV